MEMQIVIALNIVKILAICTMIFMMLTFRDFDTMKKYRIVFGIPPIVLGLAMLASTVYVPDTFSKWFGIVAGSLVLWVAGRIYTILDRR